MKTGQATGLTSVAQSGWKWNGALLLVVGGTYFVVSTTVAGAPNGRIHWPATAAALAVGLAGTLVREQLLQQAQEQRLRTELEQRYEGRIEALQGMVESTGRSAWWKDRLDDVVEGFGGDVIWKEVCLKSSADIVWVKDFPQGCVSGFSQMMPLGAGGLKDVFLAVHYVKSPDGKIERRPDCAWVQAKKGREQIVLKGLELAHSLDEHPNIYRPWTIQRWRDQNRRLTRVVTLEPRFRISLDRVRLPWNEMLSCMKGIGEGLAFLHKQLVVHKDLKPSNIALKLVDGQLVPVITDCDTWQQLSSEKHVLTSGHMDGTRDYLAAECFLKENYGRKVDVWSLALILFEQVWRSAGGVKPTGSPYLPKFVQNAIKIYEGEQNVPVWEQNTSRVAKAFCKNQDIKWPDELPEGGETIKDLVRRGLSVNSHVMFKERMAELNVSFTGGPVDHFRCTAEQFLKNLPSVDTL